MTCEVEIPEEFVPWVQQFARFYGVSIQQAVATLVIFQAACHRVGVQEGELRTYVLPWGVKITLERTETP